MPIVVKVSHDAFKNSSVTPQKSVQYVQPLTVRPHLYMNAAAPLYKKRLDDADAIRATLASDGVDIGDVHREAGVVVSEARAELKRERKLLHGRKRKQYILQGAGLVLSRKSVGKGRRLNGRLMRSWNARSRARLPQ